MSLTSEAQGLIEVVELPQEHSVMEMLEQPQTFPELVMEEPTMAPMMGPEECCEAENPENMELVVEELPGVEGLDPDLEKALEVVEEAPKEKDENDAKSKKPPTKWDWEAKGPKGFVAWIRERLVDVPKHSGYDSAGLQRAIAYMEKLDDEISRAMRLDLDGELDANQIEEVRAKIDDGIERLHARLDKIKKKRGKKRKKAEENAELIKQAQKTPAITGVVITVPLLISTICRTCINGMVSAGHSLEDNFEKMAKKYKLTEREQLECVQHFQDMGLTLRRDRGTMLDEDFDATSPDNIDFAAEWPA